MRWELCILGLEVYRSALTKPTSSFRAQSLSFRAHPSSFRAQSLSFRAHPLSFRAHPLSFRAQSRNLFKYPSEAAPHFEVRFCYSLLVNSDDDKLNLIGCSGKETPTAFAPPARTRQLEAPKQGDGWVFLDRKQPVDGGRVSAYNIQRRNRTEGAWQDVATAIETESTLADHPKGKELEYRVIAINKAGEGPPSNTVMAVL